MYELTKKRGGIGAGQNRNVYLLQDFFLTPTCSPGQPTLFLQIQATFSSTSHRVALMCEQLIHLDIVKVT